MIECYKDFKNYINKLETKPRLLLHSCCAPCSSHTLQVLKDHFKITIFYSNDNIYPKEEFFIRANEQKKLVEEMNLDIDVIVDDFNKANFDLAVKGLESLGERSIRCYNCYEFRLEKTAKYAKEHGFDFFTTTLSISPYKNSDWINELGYKLEAKYGVKFLYSNFKKEEGYKDSIKLSEEYHLYRQDYCGCIYSLAERKKQLNEK